MRRLTENDIHALSHSPDGKHHRANICIRRSPSGQSWEIEIKPDIWDDEVIRAPVSRATVDTIIA
jgi:hypothetical protein